MCVCVCVYIYIYIYIYTYIYIYAYHILFSVLDFKEMIVKNIIVGDFFKEYCFWGEQTSEQKITMHYKLCERTG